MNKRKPIETEQELLNALESFFCDDIEDQPIENIDAELQALGFDANEIGNRLGNFARESLENSMLNWRNKSREIEAAKEKLNHSRIPGIEGLDRPDLINAIQQALSNLGNRKPNMIPVFNRNFQEVSDNDLRSLLEQLNHLAQQDDSLGDK